MKRVMTISELEELLLNLFQGKEIQACEPRRLIIDDTLVQFIDKPGQEETVRHSSMFRRVDDIIKGVSVMCNVWRTEDGDLYSFLVSVYFKNNNDDLLGYVAIYAKSPEKPTFVVYPERKEATDITLLLD